MDCKSNTGETAKVEKYRHMNFFVDHSIKNYGDGSWRTSMYTINLKLFHGDGLLWSARFGPSKYVGRKSEGSVSTGRNQLDLLGTFETWNYFSPQFYHCSIEVLDEKLQPYEYYREKIGFRDIRFHNRQFLINNYQIQFKIFKLDLNEFPTDSVTNHLRDLKVHNFNSVLLEAPGAKTRDI